MTDAEHIEQLRATLAPPPKKRKPQPPPTPQAQEAAAAAIQRRLEAFEAELEKQHAETQNRIRRVREAKIRLGRNLDSAELRKELPK
jgi:glutathione S-transferase